METQHTKHISRIQLSTRSHLSHEQETWNLKLEIDHLHKKLRCRAHVRGDPTPPSSLGSNDKGNRSYSLRSRTSPNESVSACSHLDIVEKHGRRQGESSSPRKMGNDAMSRFLRQISKSPFTRRIDRAKIPHHFTQPTFTIYNGRTNPVEHMSHFNQWMTIHSRNDALMCKVFPSSLEPVAMRWFDELEEGLISSYKELTSAFEARFMTCSRVPRPLDFLLSMVIREGETLKTYSDRY